MVANYRERLDGWTTSLDVIVEGLPGRPLNYKIPLNILLEIRDVLYILS